METSLPTGPPPLKPRQRQAPPSLLACIACRKKHLKCDAQMPVCSRCENKNIECIWAQSRRGYKGPRRSAQAVPETTEALPNVPSEPIQPYTVPETSIISAFTARGPDLHTHEHPFAPHLPDVANIVSRSSDAIVPAEPNVVTSQGPTGSVAEFHAYHGGAPAIPGHGDIGLYTFSESSGSFGNSPAHLSGSTTSASNAGDSASSVSSIHKVGDPLLDAFYTSFYPAHPFVVPPQYYSRDVSAIPDYQQHVLRFVGSHFVPSANPGSLQFAALAVMSDSTPDGGHKV